MRSLVPLFLCLSLTAGLSSAEEWFDAYSQGLSALKQGNSTKAIERLQRAARLRPEPGSNLITYGTNRIDRYHPYLRLAEAYLKAGDPAQAEAALKRSESFRKEPADERSRLMSQVQSALAAARTAAAPPPAPAPITRAPEPAPPVYVAPVPVTPAPIAQVVPSAAPRVVAETGTLEVATEPSGATAILNGRFLGQTPLRVDLAPGSYTLLLRHEGHADKSVPVRILSGQTHRLTGLLVASVATPAPLPSSVPAPALVASLIVQSQPGGAAVYLDDEMLGTTDSNTGRLVKSGVAPGLHRVRLARNGYEDFAAEVQVADTGPTAVQAALQMPQARDWRPLVAIAAVLLLAGVGFYVWRRRRGEEGTMVLPARGVVTRAPGTLTSTSLSTAVSAPTLGAEEPMGETRAVPSGTQVSASNEDFGVYRLREQLGKGGMASVFRAERGGESCALKRPLANLLGDPEFLERFLREADIGRTLHHPNIIRIFERGEVAGVPYFTMELVEGETLHAFIRREGALDPRMATRIIAQVAEALDYAHLKGVIHRDLKPSNIMILKDGTVKVMDYGIARARRFEGITMTGAFLGTPDYVAPETAEGKVTDARSDLYSLGIIFYEIVTGKRPFVGDTPFATLRKHCSEAPAPPSTLAPTTPPEIEGIILRLLSKNPDDRFPGAEELLVALRDYLNRAA